ncbi:MAG: DUF4833 domain-containing protein [Myxococcota bacterium]
MQRPRGPIAAILLLALVLAAAASAAAETTSQPLFRIERSKNANIVQYDARVRGDGSLDRKEPVDAYWLRLASTGERKELKWLARRAAYGFDVDWQKNGSLELDMVAPIGRRVRVVKTPDGWEARTRIDGRESRIERIYVKSRERSFRLPKVEFIDFAGTDVESGEQRSERYVPD